MTSRNMYVCDICNQEYESEKELKSYIKFYINSFNNMTFFDKLKVITIGGGIIGGSIGFVKGMICVKYNNAPELLFPLATTCIGTVIGGMIGIGTPLIIPIIVVEYLYVHSKII